MNKLKQTAKTILIFILCSATCFLSIGCGEDLTFEDGEYTAELVAQDKSISNYGTNLRVKIKNGELIFVNNNYGVLISDKTGKNKLLSLDKYSTYNNFNIENFTIGKNCLRSESFLDADCLYSYCLAKSNKDNYLLFTAKADNVFYVIQVYFLKK